MYELHKLDPITQADLEGCYFYHFSGLIAVPNVNDFIFRTRLFATTWTSRVRALKDIEKHLQSERAIAEDPTESELSILRDYIILFGDIIEQNQLLVTESNILPQNQTHTYHEKYALASYLAQREEDYTELVDQLCVVVPQVDISWTRYTIQEATKRRNRKTIGPSFYSRSDVFANRFVELVNATVANPVYTKRTVGLAALEFLEHDPALYDPTNVKKDTELSRSILTSSRPAS